MFNDPPFLSIYKSGNGFVVKVMVPGKKSDKDAAMDPWGMEPKFFQFSDKQQLIDVLQKSLPTAAAGDTQKEMEAAFKEAVKQDD